MKKQSKNYNHTGKSTRIPENSITLDSNMVGYLYVLSSPGVTAMEYARIKRVLTAEQFRIVEKIIENNFEGITFHTTPQVITEIFAYAKHKNDYGVIDFLARICNIHIPRSNRGKVKYAELIVDLMEEYTTRDIVLGNNVREMQSAVATEPKRGEENFADAKIVAENNILNGGPLVTRNEKHLVSMEAVTLTNSLRSMAILQKNKRFLKSHKLLIPNKTVRRNLNNKKSTTYRIKDIPYLIER